MGATITCEKRAFAFVSREMRIGYALFEKTYESNVFPHRPSWNCICVGYIDEILKAIFARARNCAFGFLCQPGTKVNRKYIPPVVYVADWLVKLAKPIKMPEYTQAVKIEWAEYGTLPAENHDVIMACLCKSGFNLEAERLDAGHSIELNLQRNFDLVRALYGDINCIGAWRYLSADFSGFDARKVAVDLAYRPALDASYKPTLPEILRIDSAFVLVKRGGTYQSTHSYVEDFIADYVQEELAHPGSYRQAFAMAHQHLVNAPMAPGNMVVKVSPHVIEMKEQAWSTELIQKFASILGKNPTGFEVNLDEIKRLNTTDNYLLPSLVSQTYFEWYAPVPDRTTGANSQRDTHLDPATAS